MYRNNKDFDEVGFPFFGMFWKKLLAKAKCLRHLDDRGGLKRKTWKVIISGHWTSMQFFVPINFGQSFGPVGGPVAI